MFMRHFLQIRLLGRAVALLLALLFPAQALAHCGVLLAGVSRHDHHPHAAHSPLDDPAGDHAPAPQSAGNSGPAVVGMVDACTLAAALFTTLRATKHGLEGSLVTPNLVTLKSALLVPSSTVSRLAAHPTPAAAPLPLPLRI